MNKFTFVGLVLSLLLVLPGSAYASPTDHESTSLEVQSNRSQVSGIVKDENGNALQAVSIIVEGTSTGVTTNKDGEFTISCSPNDNLIISFIGYQETSINVGSQTFINVTLQEDSQLIDDVIVIGYGTTTRKRATGAVDQVKAEIFENRSVPNVKQALQGALPSVVIQNRSYNPNSDDVNINIRGIASMNDNTPLLVIDGLISDMGAFNKLNPSDIESVNVLKDAGTAAIYGSRAANGVLLITTKKGKRNQAPVVNVSAMVGFQDPQQLFKPVKGYQNATLYNQYKTSGGEPAAFTAEQIRDLYEHGDAKWGIYEITEKALQQNYNVSVSGGGENSTYMISAGYYDQESNYVGNYGVERYNFRTNVTTEYKRVKITGLLSYARNNSLSTTAPNLEINATRVPPYYYYKMQDPETGKYLVNDIITDYTGLGLLREGGYNKHRNDYINANVGVDFKIMDGLTLKGVLGADVFREHRYTRRHEVNFYHYSDLNTIKHTANTDRDTEDWNKNAHLINSQIMLDFNRYFGKHHVSGLIGYSNESWTKNENQVKILYADADLGIKGDGSVVSETGSKVSPEGTERRSINSLFGRASYDWNDRYFVDFTFRYDGSSKFGKDQRWGFFPSVALAWRVSEEDFMESYRNNVGELKIRTSYGELGNQSIGDYKYFTTYDLYSNTYAFNNVMVGGAGFTLGDDDLKWERTKSFNVGLDATFLQNKLTVGFDYFYRNTVDILVEPTIPLLFGTKLSNQNAGKMKSQGWELNVNYNLRHGEFNHNFNFNIGDTWNKVTKYEGFESWHQNDEIIRLRREGLPFNSYYGYKTAGIFQSYDEIANSALPVGADVHPGDLKFRDRNGDGIIDENDRYYLGNAFPRYTFGFNYDLKWKGFDFSILMQGALKRTQAVRGETVEPFHSGYSHVIYQHQLDFWTPTNTGAKYPSLTSYSGSKNNNYGSASDIYMFDAKYLRVKNIAIGYTLPQSITKYIGMQKMRVYVNAQNLFTFTKNSWIDPESSEFGGNMNINGANSARNYPSLKYYGMGIDITF